MRSLGREQGRGGLGTVRYDDARSILLLADGDDALLRGQRAAAAAAMRVVGTGSVADAAEAINGRAAIDLILVDCQDRSSVEALLPHLEAADARGCRALVVGAAGRRTDRGAKSSTAVLHMLADGGGFELLQGLHAAAAPVPLRFHDVKNAESPRLQQLSAEVGRIANILASLSEDERHEEANGHGGPQIDAALVRAIIRVRRLRDHYFRSELFADPAWDMLLDLYAARLDRQRVAVSSLCIAAAVPATTALRWIKSLTDQRLFVRVADPQDGRRVFIELSDEAAAGLEAYLRAAQRISPLIA
jgi:hypothetical protein